MQIDQNQSYESWLKKGTEQLLLLPPNKYLPSANDFYNEYEQESYNKKPFIIDYMKICDPSSYTNADALFQEKMLKSMSDLIGIPKSFMHDGTTSTPTTPRNKIVTDYPIEQTNYTEHNPLSPISPVNWQTIIREIDKFEIDCIPVFIARTKDVRDCDGNIRDPWSRSIPIYSNKFKIGRIYRKETEITADYSKEILAWIVETSVAGDRVVLVLWEEIKMSFVRQSRKDQFIESLRPNKNYKDPAYILV